MKASALFLLTAVVTGLHAFYVESAMVWGAKLNLIALVSFLGSCTLLVGSGFAPFKKRASAWAAIMGVLMTLIMYLPIVVIAISMPYTTAEEIKNWVHYKEIVPLAGTLFGPLLIAMTLTYSVALLKRAASVR
jgi:hypothetical protein